MDVHFHQTTVIQPSAGRLVRQEEFPHAVRIGHPFCRILRPFPVVEVSEQKDFPRSGQPFAKPPSVSFRVVVDAEVEVGVGVIGERSAPVSNFVGAAGESVISGFDFRSCGSEPFVLCDERQGVRVG